ncbi:TPA: colicin-like pore-forming protein [Escherichia coli]
MTDLGGKTSIFSHPVYLFLREFSLQDFRGGSLVALVFSILTGSALGIIGYGLLMAVTGALIDESLVEKANKFWGI